MTPMPGDVNKDGRVNLDDFGALKVGYNGTGPVTRADGDLDGDGDVDLDDFAILKGGYGKKVDIILIGGDGTDVLVLPADTTSAVVYGNLGKDIFWIPAGVEIYTDVELGETIRIIHETELTPNPVAGKGYADFSDAPLFTNGNPLITDINQQRSNDCYYLAVLGGLAHTEAGDYMIKSFIAPVGDGTFYVAYEDWAGDVEIIRTTGELPVNSDGTLAFADTGPGGAIWAPIAQKVFAYKRYGINDYGSIDFGYPDAVLQMIGVEPDEIFNRWASEFTAESIVDFFIEELYEYEAAILLSSMLHAPSPVADNHVYAVLDVRYEGDVPIITLLNPWGGTNAIVEVTAEQVLASFYLITTGWL